MSRVSVQTTKTRFSGMIWIVYDASSESIGNWKWAVGDYQHLHLKGTVPDLIIAFRICVVLYGLSENTTSSELSLPTWELLLSRRKLEN